MKRLMFIAGAAVGFIVGSKMGREPYEKLEAATRQFVEDPRVQEKTGEVKDKASLVARDATEAAKAKAPELADAAKAKADELKDKASDAAESAKTKVKSATDGGTDRSSDSSVAGGDAQVGDDELES